jgi:hypothetical protein
MKFNFTLRKTFFERARSGRRDVKSEDSSMKEALETAMSVPEERATETSAAVRAGVSLVPSPTKATVLLVCVEEDVVLGFWRERIYSAFCAGRAEARMFEGGMLRAEATEAAVAGLSPVQMWREMWG